MKYQKRLHWDRHRPEFLKLGLIFAMAMAFMAFNYTSDTPIIELYEEDIIFEDLLIVPPQTVQKKKVLPPPPPPKPKTFVEIEPTPEPIVEFEQKVEIEKEVETIVDEFANDPAPETPPIVEPIKEDVPEDEGPLLFAEGMPIYGSCDIGQEENERRDCTSQNLIKHIYKNVKYPNPARDYGVQGTVVVSFIVNKSGMVEDIKIMKDIGMGCGDEVKRVIGKLDKFLPGKQNGRPVSVIYRIPVNFTLQ